MGSHWSRASPPADAESEESDNSPEGSEAEKASSKASSKALKGGGGDVEAGAIEVKDPETLWKVNIEAVYRRKNPQAWLDFGAALS